MKASKAVLFTVLGIIVLALILVGVVAAGIGGEASNLNSYLNSAVSSHLPMDQVKQKLTGSGIQLDASNSPAQLSGTGPHHSAIVYSTWLTVKVSFNQDQKATSFNIDRAQGWF